AFVRRRRARRADRGHIAGCAELCRFRRAIRRYRGARLPLARMTTVRTTIANTLADLAGVPQWIAEFAAAQGISGAIVSELNVALDEVLSNIVKYGYADDEVHRIEIQLTISEAAIEAQ